eukprot:CAMPEP_0119314732 /NCGR_PEP_ID=MMETSP1333-20130426/33847_1 /TAXON_ID=418940 /ORGANISM="Scyphosphaera apsteinii, Strain RCC1455" /LENGTH=246 /DNA_ID=CAMNT_0007319915 /DNA_START=79 /DNA_END=819 /DNA_ORIENTATION=-
MSDDPRIKQLKAAANKAIAKHDLETALHQLNEAIELAPDMDVLWANRAYVRELRLEHELALGDAQQCIEISPRFAKGFLRMGRALLGLGRVEEAYGVLSSAVELFPQDYGIMEALNDASNQGGKEADGGVAESEAGSIKVNKDSSPSSSKGLASSYYYAAVPASQRQLPVEAPQLIGGATAGPPPQKLSEKDVAATGSVKRDIERKGDDSYYYAHARAKDYHIPTVPKTIEADGSLKPWNPDEQRK